MSVPPPRSRRSRKLAALVLAALAALLALDVGFRVADSRRGRTAKDYLPADATQRGLYQPHPYIGFVLRPGAVRDHPAYSWRINSFGFRGPERTLRKEPGVYRILCLGGSTTFGTGATRDERTYPAQLERLLNEGAPSDRAFEVWNCGVSGYTTAESLVSLTLRLLAFEPDAILVYHAANDARPVHSRGFRPDYAHVRRSWTETEVSALERFLVHASRLYARIARGSKIEEQQTIGARLYVPNVDDLRYPPGAPVNEEGIATFVRNVRNIVAVARANGVSPVLSTFATCRSKATRDDLGLSPVVDRMNAELLRLSKELDVGCIDVAAHLNDREASYDDWMHFNDRGSLAHAMIVLQAARDQGLFGL